MAVKLWLQERWVGLFPALQALTVEQDAEIERLCNEEIEYWRSRDISGSALRVPMTATRKEIKSWPLTPQNSYVNPRTREKEHIALKYMNFSSEEWAVMNAPSAAKFQARLEDMQYINDPDAVVNKAVELLGSEYWYDLAAALAVLTGRRYEELVTSGELFPKTLYSVTFKGQLKRRDETLPPYEIPTLCKAHLVLDAWARLRDLEAGADGRLVSAAADRHFSALVPGRSGGDLYTHLFRSVYGCIAVFYFCSASVLDIRYLARIYGHYWVLESTGETQHNYLTTLHYKDYAIGDAAILATSGKRQGVKLDLFGVEILEFFKEKVIVPTTKRGVKMAKLDEKQTERKSSTGYSILKPRQDTKEMIDQVINEEIEASNIDGKSTSHHDDVLRLFLTEHYQLKQVKSLGVDLEALAALLADAARDVEDIREEAKKKKAETYTAKKRPLPVTPLDYLRDVLTDKRTFSESYEKRHTGKDYTKMSLDDLRDTKTTEATYERFNRAIAAIVAYNDAVSTPDIRWHINAKVLTDLVGGKASLADAYIKSRDDVKEHNDKYGLSVAYNRRPVSIVERVAVPERPGEEPDLQEQIRKWKEREAARIAKREARKAGGAAVEEEEE